MEESLVDQVDNLQNVKWLDYTSNLMDTQKSLFETNSMYDVLIAVGQNQYKAHQLILTACSDFFADIFSTCTPTNAVTTVIIPDVNPNLIPLLLQFMYTGEVFVSSNYLSEFLEACRFLQVKGFISYDCMVNGIRLQQDPKQANALQPLQSDVLCEKKPTIIMPQTYDISDVIIDVDYPIKEFSIIEDVSLQLNNCESQSSSYHEQVVSDPTIEEYLEEDEDPLIQTSFGTDLVDLEPTTPTPNIKKPASTHSRTHKAYTESTLNEAIAELRLGATVVDVAAKFEIPRSTIYSKLRHSKDPVYRSYRVSHLQEAARCVAETGISLKEASEKFDVSKTVLWRTLKKSTNYKPEERSHGSRAEALKAIQSGDTLVSISKRFNIPLATLHRDKVRLHNEGKLPEHCKLTRRDSGTNYQKRLRAAVESCISGMPQKMASELHKVPKTTVWRHVQLATRMEDSSPEANHATVKVEGAVDYEEEEEGEVEEENGEVELVEEASIDCATEELLDELDDEEENGSSQFVNHLGETDGPKTEDNCDMES